MIVDDRAHDFWITFEPQPSNRFACGDTLNLTRAHGDTVRSALERHLATLEARAKSLRSILKETDAEQAQCRLTDEGRLRATQLTIRPKTVDDDFTSLMEAAIRE
jgi:hypothetical protein